MTGRAMVLRGDARALPLPDASVDLIVTSPPYYALRAYTDGGEAYDGQIGGEATPQQYVDNLLACTREWVRVLKPSGSLFVNLGDKYSGQPGGPVGATSPVFDGRKRSDNWQERASRVAYSVPSKSLIGLPWRYALGCIDQLGLILRAEILWSKPNGLPESVTDRVRRSHEQWFHLTRLPRYYSAVDEIRGELGRQPVRAERRHGSSSKVGPVDAGTFNRRHYWTPGPNPLGKLPGSVWTIPTEPLRVPPELGVDHFAAFPTEWPRRIIRGWSPPGICVECGEGRRPVAGKAPWWEAYKRKHGIGDYLAGNGLDAPTAGKQRATRNDIPEGPKAVITGYVCACPEPTAPTRPAVVLDPFGGTGTTALVASVLGRIGISVDASADYSRLAVWRTSDPGQRAHAMRVPKPPQQLDGQLSLLDHLEVA